MKSKKFIVLFTVLSCVSAFIFISKLDFESKNGSYFQKELSGFMSQTGGNEAQEWLRARYIDVTTGQTVTNERLAEIDKQIRKISKSKSILSIIYFFKAINSFFFIKSNNIYLNLDKNY